MMNILVRLKYRELLWKFAGTRPFIVGIGNNELACIRTTNENALTIIRELDGCKVPYDMVAKDFVKKGRS